MSHYEIFVYSAAIVSVIRGYCCFCNDAGREKFGMPKHVKKEGVEYAPEYTFKEKKRRLFMALLWVIPLFVVLNFLWLPWFNQYIQHAHCENYGSFTGLHIIFYGLFVAAPVTIALVLLAFMGPGMVKVFQLGQFPLPGKKVLRPTKYVYGRRARLMGALFFTIVLSIAGMGIWGYFAANDFITSLGPNVTTCS